MTTNPKQDTLFFLSTSFLLFFSSFISFFLFKIVKLLKKKSRLLSRFSFVVIMLQGVAATVSGAMQKKNERGGSSAITKGRDNEKMNKKGQK